MKWYWIKLLSRLWRSEELFQVGEQGFGFLEGFFPVVDNPFPDFGGLIAKEGGELHEVVPSIIFR